MNEQLDRYLPGVLALLIERSGGVIALTDQDVERITSMKPVIEVSQPADFSGDALRLRYREAPSIEGT